MNEKEIEILIKDTKDVIRSLKEYSVDVFFNETSFLYYNIKKKHSNQGFMIDENGEEISENEVLSDILYFEKRLKVNMTKLKSLLENKSIMLKDIKVFF